MAVASHPKCGIGSWQPQQSHTPVIRQWRVPLQENICPGGRRAETSKRSFPVKGEDPAATPTEPPVGKRHPQKAPTCLSVPLSQMPVRGHEPPGQREEALEEKPAQPNTGDSEAADPVQGSEQTHCGQKPKIGVPGRRKEMVHPQKKGQHVENRNIQVGTQRALRSEKRESRPKGMLFQRLER